MISTITASTIRQYRNAKTIFKKKNIGHNHFKKLSKFQKIQLSNFTLTWLNKGKMNSVRSDMVYSKELQQKMKMLDNLILKSI